MGSFAFKLDTRTVRPPTRPRSPRVIDTLDDGDDAVLVVRDDEKRGVPPDFADADGFQAVGRVRSPPSSSLAKFSPPPASSQT
jgi:hypothetical protein